MDDLLPHYERELAELRAQWDDFTARHPQVAGRLSVSGQLSQDPHVEHLMQSFALLSARIRQRLDDDFPQFAEPFLDLLFPHYRRPLPSNSIACFGIDGASDPSSRATLLPRGTELKTPPIQGVACRFRTTSQTQRLPMRVASAGFRATTTAPPGTNVPRQATAILSVHLELTSPEANWATLGVNSLRFYIDGSPLLVTALREALACRVLATMVQADAASGWRLTRALPHLVGLEEEDALIDTDARMHAAYRLLTEYFAFPEKFNFIDVPLPEAALLAHSGTLGLHFALGDLSQDGEDARRLEGVSRDNLVIGCVPVTNLFSTQAQPIQTQQAATLYPVQIDSRHEFGYEIYAIDRVYRVHHGDAGKTIQEFRPYYSLQHEDLRGEVQGRGEALGRYWFAQRTPAPENHSGFDTEIGLVDLDFNPALVRAESLSIDVRATNRDLPCQIRRGDAAGDLRTEGDKPGEIRLMRTPTRPCQFDTGNGKLWRLISQLSLNALSLTDRGVDALKETLRLYDLPGHPGNQRMIDALVAIDYRIAQGFLDGEPFEALVRGMEIRLTVDEAGFADTGLHLFAQVLDRFFALYAHTNSFTQLKLFSSRSGVVLRVGPRRRGAQPLL